MKKFLVLLFVCVFTMGWAVLVNAQGDGELPDLADLDAGWNMLEPGGDTLCSQGTPYAFYVRPGESDNLLVFFNGGGACWNGVMCDLTVEPVTYVPVVEIDHNNPEGRGGIFDLENEANPFADYTMVFVPYCTGDVHLGNAEVVYEVPEMGDVAAHETTIYHNGYNNAMAVLNWVYENVESPEEVFVAGSSAGAIASSFYVGLIAEQYPDAQIVQLGDAAGGYRAETVTVPLSVWDVASILPDWDEYEGLSNEDLTLETFYIAAASHNPDIVFSEYNAAEDVTQYQFLAALGVTETPLMDLLEANIADIEEVAGDIPTYTAGGDVHTILRDDRFYEYVVDDVPFVDWVTALAAGEEVEDVMCVDCANPPDTGE